MITAELRQVDAKVCPMCGSPAKLYMPEQHANISRCSNRECALEFAAPQLDDEALGRAYEKLYYPPESGEKPVLANSASDDMREFLRAIEERFGSVKGKRVLDYGCGSGVFLGFVANAGGKPSGIEPSETAREHARSAGIDSMHAGIRELVKAEPSARFDLIVLCDSIEHLRRPWEDLAALRQVLRPGGQLVAKTPNFTCLNSRIHGKNWEQRTNPTHFYYFTPTSLGAAFRKAGLRDVAEWRPKLRYSYHSVARAQVQRGLNLVGMRGSLHFTGTVFGDESKGAQEI